MDEDRWDGQGQGSRVCPTMALSCVLGWWAGRMDGRWTGRRGRGDDTVETNDGQDRGRGVEVGPCTRTVVCRRCMRACRRQAGAVGQAGAGPVRPLPSWARSFQRRAIASHRSCPLSPSTSLARTHAPSFPKRRCPAPASSPAVSAISQIRYPPLPILKSHLIGHQMRLTCTLQSLALPCSCCNFSQQSCSFSRISPFPICCCALCLPQSTSAARRTL